MTTADQQRVPLGGDVIPGGHHDKPLPRSLWIEVPILVGVALALALVIQHFLVQTFYIPSGSMENTLRVGDRVLVNKVVYHLRDIHRGDVVVFDGLDSFTPEVVVSEPTNPVARAARTLAGWFGFAGPSNRDFIKRVIGIPGDHVKCCDKQGRISVNGVPLTEPYLFPGNAPSDQKFDIVVPAGRLWVMGDHRAESADSRAHLGDPGGGTVPENKVIGRAFVVIWPPSDVAGLPIPATFQRAALDVSSAATSPAGLGAATALPVAWLAWARRRRRRLGARR